MKKLFLGLLLIISFATFSQENNGWLTSFDEAAKQSQKTKKPIMANFTGSDWCGYCKVLTRDVFNKPEFKKWAKKNVVLLELDFPKKKRLAPELQKQNNALKNAFGVRGYPTIWIFKVGEGKNPKKDLEPLGKTGYVRGGYSKWIKGANDILKKA